MFSFLPPLSFPFLFFKDYPYDERKKVNKEKSIIDRLTCLQKQKSIRVVFINFLCGIPRWKPKLSAAGDEFCKAAILFYQMGEVEASKANLLRACECFKKKRAWYSAAKTLEQAMAITHKQVQQGKILFCMFYEGNACLKK